ncbi:hypothetical protein A6R68_01507, partial [Neotoma lepida]
MMPVPHMGGPPMMPSSSLDDAHGTCSWNKATHGKDCIFTIDPSTARDLDDALSCRPLTDDRSLSNSALGRSLVMLGLPPLGLQLFPINKINGTIQSVRTEILQCALKNVGNTGHGVKRVIPNIACTFEVGVHIADVVPMLPRLLCEELCSLNPMTDKLTFSVIWKLTPEGKILEEWFGRTVIRSCTKLSYDHAQSMIENPTEKIPEEELPPISPEHSSEEVHQAVLNLHSIAKQLRQQRFVDGALRLDQDPQGQGSPPLTSCGPLNLKLAFTLDHETGMPQGCHIYEYRDSN